MKCFFCKGVAHPTTGCEYTKNVIACGPCTRNFWKWFKGHHSKWSRKGVPDFYAAASKWLDDKEKSDT